MKLRGKALAKAFLALCKQEGIGEPQREWRFSHRRFRFDYAWLSERVALEVNGGVWTQGRHTRGAGYVRDMEKMNLAAILGWRVFQVTPDTLCTRETIAMLREALKVSP